MDVQAERRSTDGEIGIKPDNMGWHIVQIIACYFAGLVAGNLIFMPVTGLIAILLMMRAVRCQRFSLASVGL